MYFTVGDIECFNNCHKKNGLKNSDSAQLHSLLGDCYRRIELIDEAIISYKKRVYSWKQKTLMLT